MEKLGLRTLQNGELVFENCLVKSEKLLGKEGQGAIMFNEAMDWERILLFASHLGKMDNILKKSVNYARERRQFGQSIGKFQSISNKIAEMKVNLELSKLILYKAAWLKDQKKRATIEASISKLFISESVKKACLDAVQIHGANGYMKEFEIERDLRDSIASSIYSGTSEIQKNIISSLLGL
jgi:alkylation response protein AidB-like acyl-CoA dehydrogenase